MITLSPHQDQAFLLKDYYGGAFAQQLVKTQRLARALVCVIVEEGQAAEKLQDEILFFGPNSKIETLPYYDVSPYSGLSPLRRTCLKNQCVLFCLLSGQLDFLIVPKHAALRRCLNKDIFSSLNITITKNDLIDRDELIQKLVLMGYERYSVVEEPGHFAVRGDILDVFSPQHEHPHRISFFDIEIETIKPFTAVNQRTLEAVSEIQLIPAHEIFLHHYHTTQQLREVPQTATTTPAWINTHWKSDLKKRADQKNIQKSKRDQIEEYVAHRIYFHGIEFFLPLFYHETGTVFDYFKPNAIIVTDLVEPFDKFTGCFLEELSKTQQASDHIESIFAPQDIFIDPKTLVEKLGPHPRLYRDTTGLEDLPATETQRGQTQSNLVLKSRIASQITKVHSLAPLASEINTKRLDGISCFIVCCNLSQQERVKDLLERFELPLKVVDPQRQNDVMEQLLTNPMSERLVTLLVGDLHEGFCADQLRQWWITDEDLFGSKTKRASRKAPQTTVFSSFSELAVGDYIIHLDHGIGIYQGLIKLDVDPHQNDFVLLEYLGGDKLYVPADRINRIQKFSTLEGVVPQLDKLGSQSWIKTRNKAKKAARKLARELLEIQAKRETLVGHGFAIHREQMEEFATSFTFEETPDQLTTITAVEDDLEATRPMDRLVCGDVGYGKTEVALRAAYKAVLDNKQVAVLVPTTVLAFQHHNTFGQRFKDYPVRVALLSRFRSQAEQKQILRDLSEGKIDVIVGTHRLLSGDVRFRDLGLLVVDEEHRFGVIHKEKIKKMKSLVDVLTLTATPIPRTLNFSLNGIRDLSIINTPPLDRLSIRTHTCYFDETTIRDAILKELRRDGQVFFVHNRVQSIEKTCQQLQTLVPTAKVRFAHGQMHEEALEDIMIAFMHREFDILVCTTIIESGLDIPNANTMIINRADAFGLAQLYQLRGRVGRSDRQAYCYLIVPHESLQTQKARRRLAVIQRFTELGSGFKVASHDLEIRGAGNILGDEQSGHIAAIGYDLYIQLLQEAIHELKNQHIPEDFEPEILLNIPAKIPADYVPDEHLRLLLYKQLSSCRAFDEVASTREEWLDRFGKLPEETENLIGIIRIKMTCHHLLVRQIKQSGPALFFDFHPNHQIDTAVFTRAIQANGKQFSISRDGKFVINRLFCSPQELLAGVQDFLEKLKTNSLRSEPFS